MRSGIRRLIAAACMVAPALGLASSASAVEIVEDGQPRAVIVLTESPSPAASQEAKVLRAHLRQISGAELPVRSAKEIKGDASKEEAWILVGESSLTEKLGLSSKGLAPGGTVLVAKGNVLALFGTDARTPTDQDGTRYAVTTFLEDFLGVRYLWPGETGKVVPARKTIVFDDFERRFEPRLGQRRIRSLQYHDRVQVGLDNLRFTKDDYERLRGEAQRTVADSPDWFGWQRLGGTLTLNGGHAFGHLWAKYGKDHPEWFALQSDGSRDQSKNPDRARLCKSNPELIAAIAKEKIDELSRNPGVLGVAVGPNDGGRLSFCTCPQCEALDSPKGRKVKLWGFSSGAQREFEHVSLTDRMVHFWNGIAEQVVKVHPDRFLVVDAYSVYAPPPVERKLHPNLVVRFASLGYGSDAYRQESLRDWDEWSKAAKRIYFRPNLMLLGRRDGLPLVYTHKFCEDIRYLAHHSMMGTDFDSICHHWATQGLNYYVAARMLWDPDQTADAIIDDYCAAGFGPAAKTMRRYFDRLESILNEAAAKETPAAASFTTASLTELRELLQKARQETAGDEAIGKRLDFVQAGLDWTDLEVRAHALLADAPNADRVAAKNILDERYALMRDLFQKSPLALNVAYISWGEDGLWGKLGWKHPEKK